MTALSIQVQNVSVKCGEMFMIILYNKLNYLRILIGSHLVSLSDLLEGRRIDVVIIKNVFPLYFKMAENFETFYLTG